jgi:Flp pilus assembly protein TadD
MNRSKITSLVIIAMMLAVAGWAWAGPGEEVFGYDAWRQAVEKLDIDPNQVVFPFQIDDYMAAWAEETVRGHRNHAPEVKLEILQQSFFDAGEFEFEYDVVRTLTAEEAFAARHGNCMSFTSLFIALSRSLGMPTFLVSVKRQPEVIKDGGLVVVNRHVVAGFRAPSKVHLFDFYVTDTSPHSSQRVLNDLEASAIYHTNIGGAAIRAGDLEEAVRNLEIAVVLAPRWAPAWVNLGVARSRLDKTEEAFVAFQRALEVEPGNSSALVNLAKIYREQGRAEEADTAMRAAAESTRNPFTLIAMADAEMLRGNLGEARQYLRRARWWYGKEPEVYLALSRLARLEGEEAKAQKYAKRAVELRLKLLDESEERRN